MKFSIFYFAIRHINRCIYLLQNITTTTEAARPGRSPKTKNLQGAQDIHGEGAQDTHGDGGLVQGTAVNSTVDDEDVQDDIDIILGGVLGSMGVLGAATAMAILAKKMRRPQAAQVEVSLSETEFLYLNHIQYHSKDLCSSSTIVNVLDEQ